MPSLAPRDIWPGSLGEKSPAWGEGRTNLDTKFKDSSQMGMPEQKGGTFRKELYW